MTLGRSSFPYTDGLSFDNIEFIVSHPVATMMIDQDGIINFANAAAEQLCNISRSGMVGRGIFDVIRFEQEYRARMLSEATSSFFANRTEIIIPAAKRSLFVDVQMVPFADAGQRILALIPSQHEAELLGDAFGRSNRAAGSAAAMLAHEIKNPLAGIKGAAQLLARKSSSDTERFTSLICKEVDRIANLIDQMEGFSQDLLLPKTLINLHQPLQQAIEIVKARQFSNIRFREFYDPSLPLVMANHDALVQIFINLITNACEALHDDADAQIRIATAYRHGLSMDYGDGHGRLALPIEVSISDNGPGVLSELRGDVFDPFVTTKREGRGLGLALVGKLTRAMGGAVQHLREDSWTIFRLNLPAASLENRMIG